MAMWVMVIGWFEQLERGLEEADHMRSRPREMLSQFHPARDRGDAASRSPLLLAGARASMAYLAVVNHLVPALTMPRRPRERYPGRERSCDWYLLSAV